MMKIASVYLLDAAYSNFFDLHCKNANWVGDDVKDFVYNHIGLICGEPGDTDTLQSQQLNNRSDIDDADHCLLVTLDAMFFFLDDYYFDAKEQDEDEDYVEYCKQHRKDIELIYYIAARDYLLIRDITIPRPGELLGNNSLDVMAELSDNPIQYYRNSDFSMKLVEDKLDLLLKIQPNSGPVDYSDD